jgi:single-strand DNA-binding protein
MFSHNRIELIGHVGEDPELRSTTYGQSVVSMSVATNERWKDAEGRPQERVEWHRITCWNQLGVTAHKYLKKGSYIRVVGRLQSRTYENKEGVKVRVWEVIAQEIGFLDRRPKADTDLPDSADGGSQASPGTSDDHLPF